VTDGSFAFPEKNVLIIGSGIGGLSAGIILSMLGFQVTIIEKNREPGGMMRSYNRSGIACNVGVHYLGSLDKGQVLYRLFDYLGVTGQIPVKRMGTGGVIDRYYMDSDLLPNGVFDMPEGLDAYEHNLHHAFPRERKQIAAIMENLRSAARKINSLEFLFAGQNDFEILDHSMPMGKLLSQWYCSPGLRAVLGVPAAWIGVPLSACPSFYHNMVLSSYLLSSWRLKCSGTEMADVFATRFISLGGRIITGDAAVSVLVSDRIAKGVTLDSGRELRAPIVIGAVHPGTILGMLPENAVRPSYRRRIARLENTHGICAVHVSVDAVDHPAMDHNLFKIQTLSDGNIADMIFYQMRESEQKGRNLLSILLEGQDNLWEKWADSRTGCRGRDYQEAKTCEAEKRIAEAQSLLGPLGDYQILDIYTPLTIRDWVGSPQGSAYGVQRSSKQILSAALLNRTVVKGLFLVGQSVLAPGILGSIMGSLVTVKFIIGSQWFKKVFSDLHQAEGI
jgi:phytoene dehydrogenase-like protein